MSQMSTAERLVYMMNQIALNFAIAGERPATLATADHVATFWEPGMIQRVTAAAARPDNGLSRIAQQAAELLATQAAPAHQSHATVFDGGHAGGSDAG